MNLNIVMNFNRKINYLFIVLASTLLSACTTTFDSEQQLLKWLANEDNGHVIRKSYEDVQFTLKILPRRYVVYNQLKYDSCSAQSVQKAMEEEANNLTMLLQIGVKKGLRDNPMFEGIKGFKAYNNRIHQLNFQFDDFMQLEIGDHQLRPKLWTFEDLYNVGEQRTVYLIFSDKSLAEMLESSANITLKFDDQIFGTGMSEFRFDTKRLNDIPAINFWKHNLESHDS